MKKWAKDLNRHLTKEDIQMTSIWQDAPYHLSWGTCKLKQQCYAITHLRTAKIQDTDTTTCWWGCGATGTLTDCWWEWEMVQPLWKRFWQFLIKLNTLLPYDPAITFLGIYPKELKTYVLHKNLPMNIYSRFIHNCQNLKATKMSFSRWIDK